MQPDIGITFVVSFDTFGILLVSKVVHLRALSCMIVY